MKDKPRLCMCGFRKGEPNKGEIKSTFQPLKKCTVNVGDIWVIQTVTPIRSCLQWHIQSAIKRRVIPVPLRWGNERHRNQRCMLGARGVGGPSATKLGNGALRTWPQCKNHALRRNLNNVRTVSLSAHAQRLILKYFYLGGRVFDEGRLTSFGQKVCRCVAPLASSRRVGKILKMEKKKSPRGKRDESASLCSRPGINSLLRFVR